MYTNNDIVEAIPTDWGPVDSLIKVIGVGGGGCNAVNYMYNQKIEGCKFYICNTDKQCLEKCVVPDKIQLGRGLGAGTNPNNGRNAALNSQPLIEKALFSTKTSMLFITAGMGGGTGTGAAPVIAAMAKERDILTVGVVTIPFRAEGREAMSKAIDGLRELEKNVDSLLIINNEKLYDKYADMLIQDAFPKANDVLATAVRSITDIMKDEGFINVDLMDVRNMMKGSGMALMGCGIGTGENRVADAVKEALESPLLNDFDLKTAKSVLVNITVGLNKDGLQMTGLKNINELIQEYTGNANNFKRGIVYDESPEFGDKVKIAVIATGFKVNSISELTGGNLGNYIEIQPDYTYEQGSFMSGVETELPEVKINKIGYNNGPNRKRLNFEPDSLVAYVTEIGKNITEIENTPAIKRIKNNEI